MRRLHRMLTCLCLLLLALPALAASPAGSWQGEVNGNALRLDLGTDGQGQFNGTPIRYEAKGNELTIEGNGEVIVYQYQLRGHKLTVSGGDLAQAIVLEHVSGKTAPAASGGVRQELVGRWCEASTFLANNGGGAQSSRCFELKADGSYIYASARSMDAYGGGMWGGTTSSDSDSGHWTATGTSITSHSVSGQTQTYQLERRNNKNHDPMICLSGTCFVTYWRKAPW